MIFLEFATHIETFSSLRRLSSRKGENHLYSFVEITIVPSFEI